MYLPRFSGEVNSRDDAELGRLEGRSAGGETILVVEDDEEVRAFSAEVLRDLGYRVLEASEGKAALRLIEQTSTQIDLLFTDVVMPGMSGKELSEEARKVRPVLKVLYTSGYTRNAIVHGGRLDPGVELLSKPFNSLALAERVREILDAGKSRRLLVAEADSTVRLLTAEALAGAGYHAEPAATAGEALGMLRAAQGRYDAIVIGADLPDKDGYALLSEVRALYADLPAVLIVPSGDHPQLSDPRSARLEKPYTATMIVASLAKFENRE
jgi:CheY-like chemotaxis protein